MIVGDDENWYTMTNCDDYYAMENINNDYCVIMNNSVVMSKQ